MNPTLHLFRHDVRRLRWWLLAWAAFLIGTHWWWHMAVWAEQRSTSDQWLRNLLHPDVMWVVVWLASQVTLAALLLLPHGPDDPRLFWRTRPIARWDMVRAKLLFAGVFLIALPLLVETGFWLAWLSAGETVALWPKMLLRQAVVGSVLLAVITLAGRVGKHYGFCVLGVLVLGGGWAQVAEQLAMRTWAATGAEVWPVIESTHLPGQVWEFLTRNPPVPTLFLLERTTMVAVVVLAVAGWVLTVCRYLFAEWRVTRIAMEFTALVMVAAAFASENSDAVKRVAEHLMHERQEIVIDGPEAVARVARMTRLREALAGTEVTVKSARLVSPQSWTQVTRRESATNTNLPAEFEFDVTGTPPGTIVMARLSCFFAASKPKELFCPRNEAPDSRMSSSGVGYYATVQSNDFVRALPELAGYELRAERLPNWHWLQLTEEVRAFLRQAPAGELRANVGLNAVRPSVMAVLPAAKPHHLKIGTAKVRLSGTPWFHLDVVEPGYASWDSLLHPRWPLEAPNLFVLRNPRTRQAVALPWNTLFRQWEMILDASASVRPPFGSDSEYFRRRACDMAKVAARHGFDAAWLADAELLCVRLSLAGLAKREVALENFRLEPAAVP